MNRKEAMRLEIRIKRMPKEKKIAALNSMMLRVPSKAKHS
jgi:predicted GIY-YIG superfamily endonuclease